MRVGQRLQWWWCVGGEEGGGGCVPKGPCCRGGIGLVDNTTSHPDTTPVPPSSSRLVARTQRALGSVRRAGVQRRAAMFRGWVGGVPCPRLQTIGPAALVVAAAAASSSALRTPLVMTARTCAYCQLACQNPAHLVLQAVNGRVGHHDRRRFGLRVGARACGHPCECVRAVHPPSPPHPRPTLHAVHGSRQKGSTACLAAVGVGRHQASCQAPPLPTSVIRSTSLLDRVRCYRASMWLWANECKCVLCAVAIDNFV